MQAYRALRASDTGILDALTVGETVILALAQVEDEPENLDKETSDVTSGMIAADEFRVGVMYSTGGCDAGMMEFLSQSPSRPPSTSTISSRRSPTR